MLSLKTFYPLLLVFKEFPRDKEICNVSENVTRVNIGQPGLVHFFPKLHATTVQLSFSICGRLHHADSANSVRWQCQRRKSRNRLMLAQVQYRRISRSISSKTTFKRGEKLKASQYIPGYRPLTIYARLCSSFPGRNWVIKYCPWLLTHQAFGLEFCCKRRYSIKENHIRNILSLTHLHNKPHNGICSEGQKIGK